MPAATKLVNKLVLQGGGGAAHLPHSTSSSQQTIPTFVYGTAWKKDRTADLVYQALCAGFQGVDTAAQPRHYREDLVGEGVRRALAEGKVKREGLYIQTKYTPISGQDPNNLPYDPKTSIPDQVKTSIASSLHNFRLFPSSDSSSSSYINTLILHSPLPTMPETLSAWRTFESFVPLRIKSLGISNCTLQTLSELYAAATIKPAVVQNRFYADTAFDVPMRRFCREHGIVYQSFWTLSANPELIRSRPVVALAREVGMGVGAAEALYALALALEGLVVLNGTKSLGHMEADLAVVERVNGWVEGGNERRWEELVGEFKEIIGEEEKLE